MRRRNVLSLARPAGWIFSFSHADFISASIAWRNAVGAVCAGNVEAEPHKSNTARALRFDSMMNRAGLSGRVGSRGRWERLQLYPQKLRRARVPLNSMPSNSRITAAAYGPDFFFFLSPYSVLRRLSGGGRGLGGVTPAAIMTRWMAPTVSGLGRKLRPGR